MRKETLDSGEIAQRLPEYRLVRELARGGMGVVYLAEEPALARRVAVKVLPRWQAEDEEFRRRFIRESRMAAALDHPNVIPIHRAGEADGLLYIVMRYVDGPSLETLLREEGTLEPPRAAEILGQAAAALDAAHAEGLIHRDVKPGNILLNRARDHAYLCDFGIAKQTGADSTITAKGSFIGTLHYASPEQIRGQSLDGRADVYSLGCVLYRCLAGAVPYPHTDTSAIMWAHLSEEPPQPSVRHPGLPTAIDRVIATALAKEPRERHATCSEMITALAAASSGPTATTTTVRDASPAGPGTPTVRAPSSSAPTVRRQQPPVPTPAPEAPRGRPGDRRRRFKVGAALAALLAAVGLITVLWPDGGGGIGGDLLPGEIVTVAGAPGFSGDGGSATNAQLNNPLGVAVAAGSVYIADADNHRIRRVTPDGVITTIAGDGTPDFSGDGGPATRAALNSPRAVAAGADGSLYIADWGNHRIRRIAPDGVITTIAGDGTPDFSGDGGAANDAALSNPRGVTVAADGSLYVTEMGNDRVRRISPDGVITTIAGTGEADFSGDGGPATDAALYDPRAVAADDAGNLYIADTANDRIRRINRSGVITTVVGTGERGFSGDGGPALDAQINEPLGIAVAAEGSLYIADWGNHRIRRVTRDGVITTIAGNGAQDFSGDGGPAIDAALNGPATLSFDAGGALYIAEDDNRRIRRIDPAGIITTVAGTGRPGFSGDGGPAATAQLNHPTGLAAGADGSLYVADWSNHRIRRITPDGVITTLAGTGEADFSGDGGPATRAALNSPRDVAVDADGNVYLTDSANRRVRRIDPQGVITTVAGTDGFRSSDDDRPGRAVNSALRSPEGVALGADGSLYIADSGVQRIWRVDLAGQMTTIAGTGEFGFSGDGGPATDAALYNPADVAVDDAGNVYIAEAGNDRVRRIDPAGIITTVAGIGEFGFSGDGGPATDAALSEPLGVAVDDAGNVYIAEAGNDRIRKVDPAGIITTFAGNGQAGFSGDGGPATRAALNDPQCVTVHAAGLYIAEAGNDRIRKVGL